MRLPFGLGRRSSSGDGASSDGSGTSGALDAASEASAAADGAGAGGGSHGGGASSPAPRAWASLPAIQRTAGDMPLVAAPGRFVQRLPGSAGLPPIVQPLGHEVSTLATPGLVVARVRAVEAPAPGAIPAPVQRRASRAQAAETAGADALAFEMDEPTPAAAGVASVPAVEAAPAPVDPPIRTMPTVSRQAIRLPERPLTSAAVAARPAAVQRATPTAAPSSDAPALPRPSGGMRRVPSPAVASPAAPVVSREVAHPATATTPAVPPPQPAAASTGSTRRGLGEPMQSAPATALPVAAVLAGPVVSRSTTSRPMPIAASNLRPVAQRSAEGAQGSMPASGSGHAEPGTGRAGQGLPELLLPHLPVQRAADGAGAVPVAALAVAPRLPAAAEPEIRPIAGANPIRPSIEIQRAASDDHDDQPPDDELPSPWWSPGASPASDPTQSGATVPALGGATSASMSGPVQRSAAAPVAAATVAAIPWRGADRNRPSQSGRSAPVAAPVQRSVASALRPGALPQPVGAGSRVGASASTGLVDSAAAAMAPAAGRAIGSGPVIQASRADAAAPATPGPAMASFGGPAPVQREEGSAPAAPSQTSTSTAPSERDLDELAQALFGRIRGRLRSDLIYDREAKGLTFDNV